MAERFQRLFTLAPNMYAEGCPVIIETGALQKDTASNKVLAQIKMKNIGDKTVSSCKVSIRAYENNGSEVDGVRDFAFLDLNVKPGESFGSKTPIYMPAQTTRRYSAFVSEVVLNDGTVLNMQEESWKTIPDRKPIAEEMTPEMVEQLSYEVGKKVQFVPKVESGLFLCACGETNLERINKCNYCENSMESLQKLMNTDILEQHYIDRKRQEEITAQETAKKKKMMKAIIIGISCAVLAIVLVVMLSSTMNGSKYEKKLAGHTYSNGNALTISFSNDGTYHGQQTGTAHMDFVGEYSVNKDNNGYYVHLTNWDNSSYTIDFYILSETSDGSPNQMEGQHTWNSYSTTIRRLN